MTQSMTQQHGRPAGRPVRAPSGEDRPRERLVAIGAASLAESELLALVLRSGDRQHEALDIARAVLRRCGGLQGMRQASLHQLCTTAGVGRAKAASLLAAVELGSRIATRRRGPGQSIRSPVDIHRHFYERLRGLRHERFLTVLLDGRHRVLREAKVSQGTLTASLVHPREVFRDAIREAAAAIVLVHNHPSGDPSPSTEDRQVTGRLREAGEILGVRIVDHVIVAEGGYFSFSEAGELGD